MVCMWGKACEGWSGDAGALPECEVKTLITPPSCCTALGRVELELAGLPGGALSRDATSRLRFVVHEAGCLYSTVLYGHPAAGGRHCLLVL